MLKNGCCLKEVTKKAKRQVTEREKNICTCILDKGLVFKLIIKDKHSIFYWTILNLQCCLNFSVQQRVCFCFIKVHLQTLNVYKIADISQKKRTKWPVGQDMKRWWTSIVLRDMIKVYWKTSKIGLHHIIDELATQVLLYMETYRS